MSVAYAESKLTESEYLEMERQAEERHGFYDGECYAMSGASRKHNRLAVKMVSRLEQHFAGKPCDAYMADMRLQIDAYRHYTYPDVMAVCSEDAYVADDMVNDATVIVEVLSPRTERNHGIKGTKTTAAPNQN